MLKKFLHEFRAFASKGSAIDMAVGVITGAALGGVVTSLVKDIITPPLGLVLKGVNFSDIVIRLNHSTTINVGAFLNAVIGFLITMFAIFMLMKAARRTAAETRETKICPYCRTTIDKLATKCPNCCSALK
ncbi:MAG: large conductance mechanosensitive channel protein MscL [Rickettsiales bacterium]|jgi:large conductance mechanosensitive channel|nr:large conductance mechanosensitive channel protein MscL [Rickettsiales bacterium]